jgi:hypothetical protein
MRLNGSFSALEELTLASNPKLEAEGVSTAFARLPRLTQFDLIA